MNPTDSATQFQVYLERLKSGFERRWNNGAQVDLRENLKALFSSLEVDSMQQLTKGQLNAFLAELERGFKSS